MPRSATFGPLRHRSFAVLIAGSMIANFGNTIQSVGASWYLTVAGEPADVVALVQTAFNLPIMLLGLPAGALCDMLDRKRILLASLATMLAASLVLALLAQTGAAGPVTIIALTGVLACGVAFIIPAIASSVNFVIPREELAAAVALNILGFNIARSFGPALGGAITALGGAGAAFLINALAYLVVIALLWRWRLPEVAPDGGPPAPPAPRRAVWAAMGEGLQFALSSRPVRAVLLRAISFTVAGAAAWAVMPLFASTNLGAGSMVYGLLLAALGTGAVIGAASATFFRARFSAEAIVRGSALIYGVACVLVALQPGLWAILALLVLAGAGWVQALSGFAVSGQMWSPRHVVGRVVALVSGVTFGGIAMGSWLWGHVAASFGVPVALAASGVAMLLMPILGLILPMPAHGGQEGRGTAARPDGAGGRA